MVRASTALADHAFMLTLSTKVFATALLSRKFFNKMQ